MLKLIDNVDYKKLEKYLTKLNIMDDNECIYSNVYCCVADYDKEFIENNCIADYFVQFFINENNEIDYCTYPEQRSETLILDTVSKLVEDGLMIRIDDKKE